MSQVVFGIVLIYLGAFLTGFSVAKTLYYKPEPKRVRTSDLYPERRDD